MGHRCCLAGLANRNDGPAMRFPQHQWDIVAVGRQSAAASMGHCCALVWRYMRFVRTAPHCLAAFHGQNGPPGTGQGAHSG